MNGWQTRPTQADIARETGLSSAAVSYALRGIRLPEETQQRVREVAERLGYETNPIARALACGRTGTVGVLCASLQDVWQQGLAAALGRAFVADGRKVMIVDAGSDPDAETELSKRLVDDRVDAAHARRSALADRPGRPRRRPARGSRAGHQAAQPGLIVRSAGSGGSG